MAFVWMKKNALLDVLVLTSILDYCKQKMEYRYERCESVSNQQQQQKNTKSKNVETLVWKTVRSNFSFRAFLACEMKPVLQTNWFGAVILNEPTERWWMLCQMSNTKLFSHCFAYKRRKMLLFSVNVATEFVFIKREYSCTDCTVQLLTICCEQTQLIYITCIEK